MEKQETRINATINALMQQRNNAMDTIVHLSAELSEKDAEIEELNAKILELEKPTCEPIPEEQ